MRLEIGCLSFNFVTTYCNAAASLDPDITRMRRATSMVALQRLRATLASAALGWVALTSCRSSWRRRCSDSLVTASCSRRVSGEDIGYSRDWSPGTANEKPSCSLGSQIYDGARVSSVHGYPSISTSNFGGSCMQDPCEPAVAFRMSMTNKICCVTQGKHGNKLLLCEIQKCFGVCELRNNGRGSGGGDLAVKTYVHV